MEYNITDATFDEETKEEVEKFIQELQKKKGLF